MKNWPLLWIEPPSSQKCIVGIYRLLSNQLATGVFFKGTNKFSCIWIDILDSTLLHLHSISTNLHKNFFNKLTKSSNLIKFPVYKIMENKEFNKMHTAHNIKDFKLGLKLSCFLGIFSSDLFIFAQSVHSYLHKINFVCCLYYESFLVFLLLLLLQLLLSL